MKTPAVAMLFAGMTVAALAFTYACAPSDFAPEQQIASVRILATRADGDAVYARPGETVTLESLMVDGRANKTTPARLYWIPIVCENPTNDLYYACFAGVGDGGTSGLSAGGLVSGIIDAGGADAGANANGDADANADADASADASADAGEVGSPTLPSSPSLTFTVPTDILDKHRVVPGAPKYGLMIAFNVACAGTLKLTTIDPAGGPQQVPIACVDDTGKTLGPNDYVIGFTRVYVYEDVSNRNPEIDGILVNGVATKTRATGTALPGAIDVDLPPCTKSGCPSVTLDVDVPESSWELDPNDKDSNGSAQHESLWVDYYAFGGSLDSEARLLYDSRAGKITGTGSTVSFSPPRDAGATLWAVVHDNRDGVTWLQVTLHRE